MPLSAAPKRPKVVCTFDSIPSKLLAALHESQLIELIQPSIPNLRQAQLEDWFEANIVGASAVIIWIITGRFSTRFIDAATDTLQVVATFSVGYDHVDVPLCRQRGIAIGTTPSCADDSEADTCLLMMLMVMRRAYEHGHEVKAGRWHDYYLGTGHDPLYLNGTTIRGKKVAFYGFGQIAQRLAERLLPLGPSKIAYKTSKSSPLTAEAYPHLFNLATHCYQDCQFDNKTSLEELVEDADVVIVLASLNDQTKATINGQVLSRFKKGAVLINGSRGPIVVTDAVVEALHSGQLGGVGLDVLEGEPTISADHPLLASELGDRVVIFPHAASSEEDSRKAMAEKCARNVVKGLGLEARVAEVQDVERRKELHRLMQGDTSFI
jgi:glyoxylate/hydroxypyruvate reductase